MFVDSLVEGKIPVKALIDTTSKSNTISRRLFDNLEEDYEIRRILDPVEKFYGDVIGEIKCLDLQFHYKGKWRSLDATEVIVFQICKNPSFDLVLGQGWLWMHKAKISFEFSPEARSHHAKIVIDSISIPLIEGNSNKTSISKNNLSKSTESKPGLAQEESVHSIEDDIEYRIFEKLCIIEYELSCINKGKLPWIKSETETSSSSSDSESTDSGRYKLQKDRVRNTKKKVVSPIRKHHVKDNKHRKRQHGIFESKKAYMDLLNPNKYEHMYNPKNSFVIVKNIRKGSIVGVFDYSEL
ncbi:24162_t:CDS:2 [Dentiscutata erythropus]|uniref:24162_t:CDS:1 n=1 Tax=Dentiscutata erythropus TaxID=1348616 RepID=A0A9N9I8N9_9GLOM|nr:24162_t:CDS:2 [Dentiscutata erythropus]